MVHYVEDNETNVEVMRGILAQRPQVQMAVSVTGLDGLAAIRAQRPDLILLDMHLPDISGLELLRHLKSDPATADIPIVVVSADALADQINEALEAGAERYLTKPVSVGRTSGGARRSPGSGRHRFQLRFCDADGYSDRANRANVSAYLASISLVRCIDFPSALARVEC